MNRDAEFMKRLLETFQVEAAEHLAVISASLLDLEKELPHGEQLQIVETIFREAHSMKGAARSVNLAGIERVCQAMESTFASVKKGNTAINPDLLDILHRGVNVLSSLVASPPEAGEPEKGPATEVINALASVTSGGTAATPPAEGRHPPEATEAPPVEPDTGTASHTVIGDTVRIHKQKLDSLLLQGESFLTVKQATHQRLLEAAYIADQSAALAREWTMLQTAMAVALANQREVHNTFLSRGKRISHLSHRAASLVKQLDHDRRATGVMVDTLLGSLKAVSMFPVSSVTDTMAKVVRDLSHDQEKQVRLTVTGGDLEVDRRILDEIREPLIHLIRNAIDHGIEKPEERSRQGKEPMAEIRLDISQSEGRWIRVSVMDDGRGIDVAKLKQAAVRLKVMPQEEVERLEKEEVIPLMFRSGISASHMITDISGRGLGLAIVRERVERIGGTITCQWTEGSGTSFVMLLPLTLATFRALLVRCRGRNVMIPLTAVKRTVRLPAEDLQRQTVVIDDKVLPVAHLGDILEIASPPAHPSAPDHHMRIVVLGNAGREKGFIVDEVVDDQEVLVKHLGAQLARVRNVLAGTILGNGDVVPILNVADLMKTTIHPSFPRMADREEPGEATRSILVVEDSITSRSLLKNILQTAGYRVGTAVDGAEGFQALKAGGFDLVVSDVDMPRMNGFELTAKIRGDKRTEHVPVILVTSLQSREDQERGIDAGANAYIVKSSFDQSNLLEVIRKLL